MPILWTVSIMVVEFSVARKEPVQVFSEIGKQKNVVESK